MRPIRCLRTSLITATAMLVFAAVPCSLMAHDASLAFDMQSSMSSSQTSTHQSGNETVPGKVDDAWITTKVKSEFAAAKRVKASDISVSTTDGVVTLTGTATSRAEKNRAIHIAKRVKGVKSVDASGLTLNGSSSTPSSSGK